MQRRPPFVPTESTGSEVVVFSLTEGRRVFREDVTGFVFRFSWTLEFAGPPYPEGLTYSYTVPTVFYDYREKIGDRFTPLP